MTRCNASEGKLKSSRFRIEVVYEMEGGERVTGRSQTERGYGRETLILDIDKIYAKTMSMAKEPNGLLVNGDLHPASYLSCFPQCLRLYKIHTKRRFESNISRRRVQTGLFPQ